MRADGTVDPQVFAAVSVIDDSGSLVASSDPLPDVDSRDQARREAGAFHAQLLGFGFQARGYALYALPHCQQSPYSPPPR